MLVSSLCLFPQWCGFVVWVSGVVKVVTSCPFVIVPVVYLARGVTDEAVTMFEAFFRVRTFMQLLAANDTKLDFVANAG